MPPLRQPDALEKLAMRAVSEYVHAVGQKVFKAICSKESDPPLTSEEETLEKQKFNLESVNTALYTGIPRELWFDVTTNVLTAINKLIGNAQCSLDGFLTTGHRRCKEFIEELVELIAPHVIQMDFTDHVTFSQRCLAKNLDRMQYIKVLKIIGVKPKYVEDCLVFLTSLTSFTMEKYCTDEIIRVLALNCKKLQTLNVTGSLGVTDKSVVYIRTLQNLQDLQISCTNISVGGVWCIVSPPQDVLNDINYNWQELGHTKECPEQLRVIAHSFLKLTRISLRIGRSYDLTMLSQMKHLKEFKVSCGNFVTNNMAGLLEAIGHQLEVLELLVVHDVDLGVIATHCVNLKTLTLRCHVAAPLPRSPMLLRSNEGLPFHKLEHLTFHGDIKALEFMLVRCTALRSLKIPRMVGVDDNFISSCLSKNPLKKLELFKVSFGAQISLRSVHLLLKSCPNLSALGGLSLSENIQPHEMSDLIASLKRKNYAINVV